MSAPIFQSRKLEGLSFLGKTSWCTSQVNSNVQKGFVPSLLSPELCEISVTQDQPSLPKHTKETFGILHLIWVCTLIPILIWVHYLNFMSSWHWSSWSCSYSAEQSFLICNIWIPSCKLFTKELLEPLKIFWPRLLSLNFLVRWFHLFFSSSYCSYAGARY